MEVCDAQVVRVGEVRDLGSVRGWRVVAVDQPPFGMTTVNDPDPCGVFEVSSAVAGVGVVACPVVAL